MNDRLRFGILGAAMIAPWAIVRPARLVEEVELVAIAARDPARAERFARKHGIPKVHASYDDVINDPGIDAIYVPLPNSHHCEWSIKSLEAGKHVLCEKPVSSNAGEAERMAEAEKRTGKKLVEAFHYLYHPLMLRVREIIAGGEIGDIRRVKASFHGPLFFDPGNIRYQYDLAGGTTMDMGCYCISLMRFVTGAEPVVKSARAKLSSPQVDQWMTAELDFPSGIIGEFTCSFVKPFWNGARITGTRGDIDIINFIGPQVLYHRLKILAGSGARVEKFKTEWSWTHQLRAFAAHVLTGQPVVSNMEFAIANMRAIDAVYEAAGLQRRGRTI